MKILLTILLCFAAFISKANDTTYVHYTVIHDTTETTTIPERIIHTGDSSVTVLDSFYNVYYQNQLYSTVDGSVIVTIPLYDTIAAHDSTFLCTNCAVHDTVAMVITPSTPQLYGTFILNNPPTLLPQKITQTKNIGPLNTVYRYNSDRGDINRIKQIKDSGLLVAWTYNNMPVQSIAYFPTGSALTAFTKSLDSMLTIAKPDFLAIENEEGNPQYHKGTAADYLTELNACVTVAHNHNVPISNGGLTQGVAYSLRKWYSDRGRTDSVTWLNNALHLNINPSSYSQTQLAWYEAIIAGLAASDVDYVNFHWYEPVNVDNLTPVVTTGVLPAFINYLKVVTGKPVITTESGTRNTNTALLHQMFDEIKASGVDVIIYYDGIGSFAIQNEAAWVSWLLIQ